MISAAMRIKVLVNASGPNIRPSWASSMKTGRKLTMVVVRAVITAGDTSDTAR